MRQIKRLALLLLCLMMAVPALADAPQRPVMQVHQMSLGFANGYLIRIGDLNIAIDCGDPDPKHPNGDVMTYLAASGIDHLDAHIITHWHLDHCSYLNEILALYGTADTVVYGPSAELNAGFAPLANGTYRQMIPGDVLTFGEMVLTCVGPQDLQKNGNRNEDSLNFVVQYGERKILFTGDFAASRNINGEYREICANVDVLQFPHHGTRPYHIGVRACGVVAPEYVLIPGVQGKLAMEHLFGEAGVKFPKMNAFNSGDGHIVILTDGDFLELHSQVPLEEVGGF